MGGTRVKGKLIEDGTIQRVDVDTTTSGQALIRKVIAGTGVTISSTGADTGTGDVTINAGTSEYIGNYNAEVNTTGWSNSGANFTISRTTTGGEVLRGTASFKLTANGSQAVNDYISTSFTLDPGDVNAPLALQFYFKGISSYDYGDVEVVLHDGTNEIIPSITKIPGGGPGFFEAIWISNSNTAYTLRFKAKVTTAFSISIDEVFVRRREVVRAYGSPITDMEEYGPLTIGAVTTPPSKGTVVLERAMWCRMGSYAFISYEYVQSSSGSGGSGVYKYPMPPGLKIDHSRASFRGDDGITSRGILGHGWLTGDGSTGSGAAVRAFDADNLSLLKEEDLQDNGDTQFSFSNSSLRIHFTAMVPIAGWKSNVVLQNSRVEYVSNSSTNDGDDTSTFNTGIIGSVIPAVTSNYKKRVEFQYPISQTDDIEIQADWDAQGIWNRWEDQGYDNATYGKLGPTWEYVSGSKYQIDVWMRGNQYARFRNSDSNVRSFTQENTAGSRWRVRKTANPLAVESAHIVEFASVRNEQSSGTAGGTASTGAWTDLTLNTVDNPNGYSWISLSSNTITLTPGTYNLEALKPFYRTDTSLMRLYNTTSSTTVISGTTVAASSGSGLTTGVVEIKKNLILSATTSFKLQYYVGTSTGTSDLGNAGSQGTEVYLDVQVRKYA
jgi:hypothetical protein